jgi:hypothetical protein
MFFGIRRGMPLALALATALGLSIVMMRSARADGMLFQHTIPREVDAYDFTTGGPFMAPPVPYGHYAKDYAYEAQKHIACVACQLHALMAGGVGKCFLHKGAGDDGEGLGHGHAGTIGHGSGAGFGHGQAGVSDGAGYDAGHGMLGHQGGLPYGSTITRSPIIAGTYPGGGIVSGPGAGVGSSAPGFATTWAQSSGQIVGAPVSQGACTDGGCKIAGKHSHLANMINKIRCGSCGGGGCGACAGTGATGLCGHPGCGLGAGHSHGSGNGNGGGTGCPLCGGRGCANCLAGLKSGLASGLGALHGKLSSLAGALHAPKMSWFNGAGGPVPLTPGYVPYIVTTRSPRDFFSFPPMNPNDP